MIRIIAIAVLLMGWSVNSASEKPKKSTAYTLAELMVDLGSEKRDANTSALKFLYDHVPLKKDDGLFEARHAIIATLISYVDRGKEREHAIRILGRMKADAKPAVPKIAQFIKRSTAAGDRLALVAQYSLREIGESAAEAVPALIDSFPRFYFGAFDNIEYRRALPITLMAIAPRDPRVKSLLDKGVLDEDGGVRVHSAWQLWQLGVKTSEVKDVWIKALREKDAVVRERVGIISAHLAQKSPELLSIALTALKDPEAQVRCATISMLSEGNFHGREVLNAYLKALSDSHWYVRVGACECLGKMERQAVNSIPQLKKALEDKEMMVGVAAARAIYKIDRGAAPSLVDLLTKALTDSDHNTRCAAATGLGELGVAARSALPALRKALYDEWVRENAVEAIAKIEGNEKGTRKGDKKR